GLGVARTPLDPERCRALELQWLLRQISDVCWMGGSSAGLLASALCQCAARTLCETSFVVSRTDSHGARVRGHEFHVPHRDEETDRAVGCDLVAKHSAALGLPGWRADIERTDAFARLGLDWAHAVGRDIHSRT